VLLPLLVLLAPYGCGAEDSEEQTPAVKTLAILDSDGGEPYAAVRVALLAALAEAGYEEGKTLEVVHHTIFNDEHAGRELLPELKADVYFLNGTVMARAAKAVGAGDDDRLFVFASVTDPVGEGLIDAFDIPPTRNMTGVSYAVPVHIRFNVIMRYFPYDRSGDLRIGLVYADMPQSQSYRRWIEEALEAPAVAASADEKTYAQLVGVQFLFRQVAARTGPGGNQEMADDARAHVLELNDQVDLFVSPNDQMGANEPFARMVREVATKPLIGLGRKDVVDGWGAMASIYPSNEHIGQQAATMVTKLLQGEDIRTLPAEVPKRTGYTLSVPVATELGLTVPDELRELVRPEDLVE